MAAERQQRAASAVAAPAAGRSGHAGPAQRERRVVMVGYDGIELLDVACVTSSLDLANRLGAKPRYRIEFATVSGKPARCDSGLELPAQATLGDLDGEIDTLVVSGGNGHANASCDPELLDQLRRLARRSRRVASVCTGATVLAATGLLNGRKVTTHWRYADELAARFPAVRVDPTPIFLQDKNIWTSGGVTAALDLALAFVEADNGAERSRWVAMALVTYLQRPGNQAQMSMFVKSRRPDHDLVRRVLDHITAHPDAELSLACLADLAGVSERHLTRLTVEHTGQTPARLVRQIRLTAAATALATTDRAVAAIARSTGFRSPEALRQVFQAAFGISPSNYRAVHRRHRP